MLGITGEKYGNYGEVPIPGSGVVRLPAGEVIVSFGTSDHQDITPPAGVSDPLVTEDLGDMVVVGDDARFFVALSVISVDLAIAMWWFR